MSGDFYQRPKESTDEYIDRLESLVHELQEGHAMSDKKGIDLAAHVKGKANWNTWVCTHEFDGDRIVGRDEECPCCGTHFVLGAGPSPAFRLYQHGWITAAQYLAFVDDAVEEEIRQARVVAEAKA